LWKRRGEKVLKTFVNIRYDIDDKDDDDEKEL